MNQNDVYYIKKHHSRNPGNKGITKMDMVYIDFYLFDISVFIHLFIYLFIYNRKQYTTTWIRNMRYFVVFQLTFQKYSSPDVPFGIAYFCTLPQKISCNGIAKLAWRLFALHVLLNCFTGIFALFFFFEAFLSDCSVDIYYITYII